MEKDIFASPKDLEWLIRELQKFTNSKKKTLEGLYTEIINNPSRPVDPGIEVVLKTLALHPSEPRFSLVSPLINYFSLVNDLHGR